MNVKWDAHYGGDKNAITFCRPQCAIIMYHYVRDLLYTRYPKIKGLTISSFREQLIYLKKYYNFVRAKDLIAAIYENKPLPENAIWLTFDDGYIDHYTNVFPILDEFGIEGAFFPPAKAILKHEVLDVNKIHFILASTLDMGELINDVYHLLDEYRADYRLESNEAYYQKLAKANRFDSAEVIFVKRLLQVEMPEEARRIITDELFRKYVTEDEAAFSCELYMSEDQLKCMLRHGMCIGSHGYDHYWLDSLESERQAEEIDLSMEFLRNLGVDMKKWIMNYPYGAYNDSLVEVLKKRGCAFGLSTQVGVADFAKDDRFALPRLDTNDLPKERDAGFLSLGR